jgi:hypothetical protein
MEFILGFCMGGYKNNVTVPTLFQTAPMQNIHTIGGILLDKTGLIQYYDWL